MKKIITVLCMLAGAGYPEEMAQSPVSVKVTGNRVSLRAAPSVEAVLLDRAMAGDELILKDNSNPEWVGVLPPETVDLWVNREFLEGNSVVPELLNIRSGPSVSHSVVGTAVQGEILTLRGELADWVRIVPTSNTVIWISRRYVELPLMSEAEPETVPVVAQIEPAEPASVETLSAVQEPVQPECPEPFVADAPDVVDRPVEEEPVRKKFLIDPSGPQGVSAVYSGVLQPAENSLYRLVDPHFTDVTVCYVRGNAAQMQTFSGMKLELSGKTYRIQGADYPVLIPERIRLLPASR